MCMHALVRGHGCCSPSRGEMPMTLQGAQMCKDAASAIRLGEFWVQALRGSQRDASKVQQGGQIVAFWRSHPFSVLSLALQACLLHYRPECASGSVHVSPVQLYCPGCAGACAPGGPLLHSPTGRLCVQQRCRPIR